MGHFAALCKTKLQKKQNNQSSKQKQQAKNKNVGYMNSDQFGENHSSDSEFSFGIHTKFKECLVKSIVGGVPINLYIDSGASCNMIDVKTWNNLKNENVICKKYKPDKQLYAYGSKQPLKLLGKFVSAVQIGDNVIKNAEFYVLDGEGIPLLGRADAEKLGVLKIGTHMNMISEEEIMSRYSDLFSGVGTLKDYKVKLHINKDVKPVAQAVRRLPFSLREKVSEKLNELESMGIIEKVQGPSQWVSPIVVVPKPSGEVRICVDMRQANEAILRERYPIPTVDEILYNLNGSTVFSKLDLRMGFHQLELEEESRDITTFVTHQGLYRYRKLSFGICVAPEIYQHTLQQVLQDCEGVQNISDDVIVHGKDREEHDKRLVKVLERLREKGLTLNKDKCQFRFEKLEFFGNVLTKEGINPMEAKVSAVKNARRPENQSEVRSFLGLVNFNCKFMPHMATVSEPLRSLTRKHQAFKWEKSHEQSFQRLKEMLSSAQTLAYYDKDAPTQVIADASPVGLGAVLVQFQKGNRRVISYASRSLSDVERRYSQTEKEALALVWACERFHLYLYGKEFELVTDHKALETIYSKKSKPSARIERWVLRLLPYTFKVKYVSGPKNVADALSRLTQEPVKLHRRDRTEEYVRFLAESAAPTAITIKDIEQESYKDQELTSLRKCIKSGDWAKCENLSYKAIKDELCVVGQVILRGSRIVVPTSLRKKMINIAHEGHQGITKTKQRLRSTVWWPKMDREIEKACKTCKPCQLVSIPSTPEPMKRTALPTEPWRDLALDLMGPFPSGETLLVIVDYYSRYTDVVILKNTSTENIIESLENIFATFGLPQTLKTDNGSQFISEKFQNYLKDKDIIHITSTPLWPQGNGEIEIQNKTLLKAIRCAHAENKNWKNELRKFLVAYRTTPHTVTGISPSELMFNRRIKTKLPDMKINISVKEDEGIRDRDAEMKLKGKLYADSSRGATKSQIQIGDKVLLEKRKENKLSTTYEKEPFTVTNKHGTEVTISKNGVTYKRNSKQLRKFYEENQEEKKEDASNNRPKRETKIPVKWKDFVK
jgi:hypothetical protein